MGKEIERKFLVDKQLWHAAVKPAGVLYRQGYLQTDPARTVRIRIAGDAAWVTIKGKTVRASRPEFEYPIPVQDAAELLESMALAELSKIRFKVRVNGKVWEVDEFLGDNEGLIVAEIELEDEDEPFDLPAWVTKEVTDDPGYYNSNLTLNPYSRWEL